VLVQRFLEDSATRLPAKVCLVSGGRRLTYREVDTMANRLANAMIAAGMRRGDRVALFLGNTVEAVVSIFAVLKAGGVFVPINCSTKHQKLDYILRNCGARGLVTEARTASSGLVGAVMRGNIDIQFVVVTGEDVPDSQVRTDRVLTFNTVQSMYSGSLPACANVDLDLACLIYTSGSTGEPKGVMSDHSNVEFASGSIIEYLHNTENDVVINVLPLSFDYGLYQLLMTSRLGGTLVLEHSFAFPNEILQVMAQERVTGFPAVPTMFAMLANLDLSRFDLSALRYATNTGAALPLSHIRQIRRKLPGVRLYSMYGLTETKRTLYLPPEELDARPDSVGIPIPGTETWLEDEEGRRLPAGETGELVVRGRHVMRGYWDDPNATAKRFRPGPLPGERVCRTGDLFRTDADGFFYFVGRQDDMLKCRGEKVAPKEIENVLYEIAGVVEAAIVGVPDPVLGQAIKALLVVMGRQITEAEVRAHCKANLEDFMVPKYIEFCDQLPKTSSGKIAKKDLTMREELCVAVGQ
jgi:long-chain acyl-CoA synthetase